MQLEALYSVTDKTSETRTAATTQATPRSLKAAL